MAQVTLPASLDRQALLTTEKLRYGRRQMVNRIAGGLMFVLTALSVSVLLLILYYVFSHGLSGIFPIVDGHLTFNLDFFVQTPRPPGEEGGGVGQAILGTVEVLLTAAVVAVPIGVGAAIYLSEYASHGRFAQVVRFALDLLAELPSSVVGVFIWATLVRLVIGSFAGIAGAAALTVIMIPIIARSVEQILNLVPDTLREGGLALGLPKWRVVLRIVIPSVLGGIATGILLSLARAAGETAPLLLTMLGNQFYETDLRRPMDALPLQIYRYAVSPYPDWHEKAWTSTMILIVVIAVFSGAVRYITGRKRYDA